MEYRDLIVCHFSLVIRLFMFRPFTSVVWNASRQTPACRERSNCLFHRSDQTAFLVMFIA